MIYKITPAPTRHDLRVEFAPNASMSEVQRGAGLAGSLNARTPRRLHGWVMSAGCMARWRLLFDAGFESFTTSFSVTRFRRWPGESMRMNRAVEIARAQVEAGKELESVE